MSNTSEHIKIACPNCKGIFEAERNAEGNRVECPACGKEFLAHRETAETETDNPSRAKKKRKFGVLQIVAAVLFCFQVLSCCNSSSNQDNAGGNRFETADGHRRSGAVSALKAFSAIAYGVGMIPGTGPMLCIPAMGVGFGANLWANAVQRRADERWGAAQQGLNDAGIDPSKPFGNYPGY